MPYLDTYGSRARLRARLMAVASSRWCFAHVPVIRRGMIFPRSDVKRFNPPASFQSIVAFLMQNLQTFLLKKVLCRPRPW